MNIKYIDTGTLYEGLKGAVVNIPQEYHRRMEFLILSLHHLMNLTGSLFIFQQEMVE